MNKIDLDLLQSPEQHIQRMLQSVIYINSRLETFYNTELERADIQRNKDYLEIMLAKDFILNNIQSDQMVLVKQAIDKASSALLNNAK